jgi:dCMP deaminase
MNRPNWDNYFMNIAEEVSTRGTCDRKQVGAVIVDQDKHILSSGYNGSIPGLGHCSGPGSIGHDLENGHCRRTLHSETNAVAHAAKKGISLNNSTLYCNTKPCWDCFKVIIAAGVTEVVYRDEYPSLREDRVTKAAEQLPWFTFRRLEYGERKD